MASWMPDSLVKITQDPRWSKEKKRKRQKRSIQKFKRRHSVKVKTLFLILAVSSSSSRKVINKFQNNSYLSHAHSAKVEAKKKSWSSETNNFSKSFFLFKISHLKNCQKVEFQCLWGYWCYRFSALGSNLAKGGGGQHHPDATREVCPFLPHSAPSST